jgi:hypothetical protein
MSRTRDRKANKNENTIVLRIRFHTDKLSKRGKGWIIPKHAWEVGKVEIEGNRSHDIVPSETASFTSLMELPKAIEKILIKHEVKLHLSRHMAKYLVCER